MPNCESYAALISAAVDGELLPEERTRLMDHLADCPACREIYAQTMAIHAAFEDWEEDAPEGLVDGVMDRIHAQRRRARRWLPLGVAAACCAVVLLGTQVSHTLSPKNNAIRSADPASVSDEEDDSQNTSTTNAITPPNQIIDSDDVPDEPVEDPTMEAALTYFNSGSETPDISGASGDTPSDGADATRSVYAATLTCENIAMEDWMTEHIQKDAYVSTDSDEELSAFAWLISYSEYTELTVYLNENNIPYSQETVSAEEPISEGDMIRVVYLEPTNAQ